MVDEFTQTLLGIMVAIIMLGMGASLTPRDFYLALRRPYGLAIGVVSQYGIMPLLGFLLALMLAVPERKRSVPPSHCFISAREKEGLRGPYSAG